MPTNDQALRETARGTAGPAGAGQPEQAGSEDLLGQARHGLDKAAEVTTAAAREAYRQGRQYARAASDRWPDAEHYLRDSTSSLHRYAAEHPFLTLVAGVGLGYALSMLLPTHAAENERAANDHRTRRSYAPQASVHAADSRPRPAGRS